MSEEGVASFALLRTRFAIYVRLEYAVDGCCFSEWLNVNRKNYWDTR